MKKILTTLTLMVGIGLFSPNTKAQEYPGCFKINEQNEVIYLNDICPQSSQDVSLTGVLKIPIKRRQGNIPVVEATFNNQETFEMLIDTGATLTTLTAKMATELGLPTGGTLPIETVSGFTDSSTSKVPSIQVGDIVMKDVQVIVSPSLSVGLLGQNFFTDYDLTIKQDVIEFRKR